MKNGPELAAFTRPYAVYGGIISPDACPATYKPDFRFKLLSFALIRTKSDIFFKGKLDRADTPPTDTSFDAKAKEHLNSPLK